MERAEFIEAQSKKAKDIFKLSSSGDYSAVLPSKIIANK
jgi:hypothetical protein